MVQECGPCVFSACGKYRYSLWREGFALGTKYCLFIGLNPSTADETTNDPTIRRCIRFAKDWGYNALCMTNLFAFRATEPSDMMAQDDPVGPDNDSILLNLASRAGRVVAAWGVHGSYRERDQWAISNIDRQMTCLGLTKDGHPRHPLYVRANQEPMAF